MSCGCKKQKCKKCYPLKQEDCYDVDVESCPTPCPNGVQDTDCVFFNGKLKTLGIKTSTSLSRVLEKIDGLLSIHSTSFSGIDWHSLSTDGRDLIKIYDVIQFVSDALENLKIEDSSIELEIQQIKDDIAALEEDLLEIYEIKLSSSAVGVNLQDDVRTVLQKILTFLENLPAPIVNNFYTTVEISSQVGNQILILPDGLYVPNTSALTILEEICNTPALTEKFTTMVNNAGLKHMFHLSNKGASAVQVNYISTAGVSLSVAVNPNGTKEIHNVKKITTAPSSTLTITYLGNE